MKARKLPIEIEFFPCEPEYEKDILKWATKDRPIEVICRNPSAVLIATLEGNHLATEKDMVIKGIDGECYPCKKHIFLRTYEIIK